MKTRWLVVGGALVSIAAVAWLVAPRTEPRGGPDSAADRDRERTSPPAGPPLSPRAEGGAPNADAPPAGPAVESPPVKHPPSARSVPPLPEQDPLSALEGLELTAVDDALREALRVPRSDQIGRGVLVTKVHPNSPAAEISLQPQDVIVRAQRKPVDAREDLEDIVRGRDHTLLIVARNGRLYELVLKPRFRP